VSLGAPFRRPPSAERRRNDPRLRVKFRSTSSCGSRLVRGVHRHAGRAVDGAPHILPASMAVGAWRVHRGALTRGVRGASAVDYRAAVKVLHTAASRADGCTSGSAVVRHLRVRARLRIGSAADAFLSRIVQGAGESTVSVIQATLPTRPSRSARRRWGGCPLRRMPGVAVAGCSARGVGTAWPGLFAAVVCFREHLRVALPRGVTT
jgi:hypothetical protein